MMQFMNLVAKGTPRDLCKLTNQYARQWISKTWSILVSNSDVHAQESKIELFYERPE